MEVLTPINYLGQLSSIRTNEQVYRIPVNPYIDKILKELKAITKLPIILLYINGVLSISCLKELQQMYSVVEILFSTNIIRIHIMNNTEHVFTTYYEQIDNHPLVYHIRVQSYSELEYYGYDKKLKFSSSGKNGYYVYKSIYYENDDTNGTDIGKKLARVTERINDTCIKYELNYDVYKFLLKRNGKYMQLMCNINPSDPKYNEIINIISKDIDIYKYQKYMQNGVTIFYTNMLSVGNEVTIRTNQHIHHVGDIEKNFVLEASKHYKNHYYNEMNFVNNDFNLNYKVYTIQSNSEDEFSYKYDTLIVKKNGVIVFCYNLITAIIRNRTTYHIKKNLLFRQYDADTFKETANYKINWDSGCYYEKDVAMLLHFDKYYDRGESVCDTCYSPKDVRVNYNNLINDNMYISRNRGAIETILILNCSTQVGIDFPYHVKIKLNNKILDYVVLSSLAEFYNSLIHVTILGVEFRELEKSTSIVEKDNYTIEDENYRYDITEEVVVKYNNNSQEIMISQSKINRYFTEELLRKCGNTVSTQQVTITQNKADQSQYIKVKNVDGDGNTEEQTLKENKLTLKVNDKEKCKLKGHIGYKAGATEKGEQCIIKLFVPPDAYLGTDETMWKYRASKCKVLSIKPASYYNSTAELIETDICCGCLNEKSEYIMQPCHHTICGKCFVTIISDVTCPQCLKNVKSTSEITHEINKSIELLIGYSFVYHKQQEYIVDDTITIDNYDKNHILACSSGIHFHMNYKDAFSWFHLIGNFKPLKQMEASNDASELKPSNDNVQVPTQLRKRNVINNIV